MASSFRFRVMLVVAALAVLCASAVSFWVALRLRAPILPPITKIETVVRPQPNVLLAVQDLARIESVSYHMERVIDLTEKQSRLFGLIESRDAILLIAVADVTAGVDLGKLAATDIDIDPTPSAVHIRLPAPEIFHVTFDKDHTYVHTRHTDLLASRQENLETKARNEAERVLVDAARDAGILARAGQNARKVVEGLVRSLGYQQVTVTLPNAE
jgi:hypothetical protein